MISDASIQLKQISKNGKPPETRLQGAFETAEIVEQLIDADSKRNYTDAKIKGMIDGNPPYDQAALDENNQSWRCNVNWRIGEAFLNIALSIYWNLTAEGPTKATCLTRWGRDSDQNADWSGIITEEFERLNIEDSTLTNMFRDSQHDMVLYRMGPVMWMDAFDFRAKPIKCSNFLTLDKTKSHIDDWKLVVIRTPYTSDELYACVANEKAATAYGWNVPLAKKVLMEAFPFQSYKRRKDDWAFFQQRIRNNDLHVSMEAESIPVAHVLVKEFAKDGEVEGRISHMMIVEGQTKDEYLYKRVGRYENWRQAICPFYYDTGDGEHHSVKGMGVKAFGALDRINRLMGHEVDLAFIGSALNFQFQTEADKEAMQMMQMGVVNFWPRGINLLTTGNTGQLIAAPGIVRNNLLNTVTSNLSQYRQGLEQEKGNPITAREVNYRAENQNFVSKSSLEYYFEQSDDFYAERFRRAANPNLSEQVYGGRQAIAFQERCFKRGVPKEALQRCYVTATRTVGYGSPDARMQAMMRLLNRYPLYNETGKARILEDITAADVGHSIMRRYIPENEADPHAEFQRSQAQDKVGLIKQGILPVVTPDQNPVIFADTYIMAAAQAQESLQQGANPAEIVAFVDLAGESATYQLQRFANDPMRKQAYDELNKRLQQIAKMNDQLKQQLQQQQEQQGQQQQKTQQAMSDEQIDQFKAQRGEARKDSKAEVDKRTKAQKTAHGMRLKEIETQQRLAINDVSTAQTLQINRVKAAQSSRNGNGK